MFHAVIITLPFAHTDDIQTASGLIIFGFNIETVSILNCNIKELSKIGSEISCSYNEVVLILRWLINKIWLCLPTQRMSEIYGMYPHYWKCYKTSKWVIKHIVVQDKLMFQWGVEIIHWRCNYPHNYHPFIIKFDGYEILSL